LADSNLALNASRIRSLLSRLAADLSVHLYLEDKELYPAILSHADPAVRAKGSAYMEEMGGLMATFKLFIAKYHSTELILAVPLTFVQDTESILQALTQRIAAEETELFMMLEGLPI
ncbi:MAG: hemerythrin domain-containing protein, partial [Holophaga sp.]|nr:hemerythrin domain-containing protein [Holophaga sp.]